ncbi:MAG: sugar ABC transporter permease [Chloroflexi bacterium]|nr:MAG: sugar ABC transporter permease [Chloroflexota bacterium]
MITQWTAQIQKKESGKILQSLWRRKLSRIGIFELIVGLGVLIYFLMTVLPLFMAFSFSFTNQNILYKTSEFVDIQNYIDLISDKNFTRSFFFTARMSVFVTLAANIGGLLVALMLNHPGRYYTILRTIFFIPQVLSAVIVAFIWKIILVDRGLLNIVLQQIGLTAKNIHWLGDPDIAFYSVVLVVTWQLIGFCTVIYLASLQSVPKDLLEAAQIDGANRRQQFRHITWPLLAPGVTINVVLLLIITFKLYDQVAVLTGGGPGFRTETLSYYIIRVAFSNNQLGYASTIAVFLFVVTALISGVVVTGLKKREVDY